MSMAAFGILIYGGLLTQSHYEFQPDPSKVGKTMACGGEPSRWPAAFWLVVNLLVPSRE